MRDFLPMGLSRTAVFALCRVIELKWSALQEKLEQQAS